MQAGRMRQRVAIQTNTPTNDAVGEPIPSWATSATVWASVLPIGGQEQQISAADREHATMRHRVRMRYRAITPRNRLLWGTRVLDIESIEDPDGKQHELVLVCSEELEATA